MGFVSVKEAHVGLISYHVKTVKPFAECYSRSKSIIYSRAYDNFALVGEERTQFCNCRLVEIVTGRAHIAWLLAFEE